MNTLPEPIRSGSSSPDSILASMFLEHLRKASSTLSPVLALVSRNIRPFSCANLLITFYVSDKIFLLPNIGILTKVGPDTSRWAVP